MEKRKWNSIFYLYLDVEASDRFLLHVQAFENLQKTKEQQNNLLLKCLGNEKFFITSRSQFLCIYDFCGKLETCRFLNTSFDY